MVELGYSVRSMNTIINEDDRANVQDNEKMNREHERAIMLRFWAKRYERLIFLN